MQAEVKDAYWKIFDTEDLKTPPGPRLVEIIDARVSELAARYQAIYPAAAKILLTDREGLTAYLRFPAEHHHCAAIQARKDSRPTRDALRRPESFRGAEVGPGPVGQAVREVARYGGQ